MKTISYDFQGWPMYAMTLWEILEELGLKKEGNKIVGEINENLLNAYPRLLRDDGMGYGVESRYVCEVSKDVYEDEELHVPVFNIFRERYTPDLINKMENNETD